jgi:uncharacterized protein YbjT (DUF2867 family)
MKKALIFGATGFIGSYLLSDLLNNPEYEQVTIVVRKNPNIAHPRLNVLNGDFDSLVSLKENLVADDVFIALGTTKKKIPKQNEYYKIDHDYPVLAAKLAKENGAKSVFLVTSVGAKAQSKVFYIRTKGETERDIAALGFEHTHIFRPSMLLGNRLEHRPMEKTLIALWSFINPVFVGKLAPYKGIDGKDVAQAMVAAARNQTEKLKIYQWNEMHALVRRRAVSI